MSKKKGKGKGPAKIETRGQWRNSVEYRHPELIPLLGNEADVVLGDRFGVSRQAIAQARKRMGVGPYTGRKAQRKAARVKHLGLEWLKSKKTTPPLCRRDVGGRFGAEPSRTEMFAYLRDLWVHEEEGRNYQDLAESLKYDVPRVSGWATGSGTSPPWHVLMSLCHELGLAVLVTPQGAKVVKPS